MTIRRPFLFAALVMAAGCTAPAVPQAAADATVDPPAVSVERTATADRLERAHLDDFDRWTLTAPPVDTSALTGERIPVDVRPNWCERWNVTSPAYQMRAFAVWLHATARRAERAVDAATPLTVDRAALHRWAAELDSSQRGAALDMVADLEARHGSTAGTSLVETLDTIRAALMKPPASMCGR